MPRFSGEVVGREKRKRSTTDGATDSVTHTQLLESYAFLLAAA
jgi:hypothetical protein